MPGRRHGRSSLRRWFQFRLRTIFVVTTLIALAVAWVAYMMHRARFQANAVANVQSLGGVAYYGYQFDQDQDFISTHVRPDRTILHETFGDDAVENIVCVDLNHTQAGDADLKKLDRLTRIRRLHLAATKVTDAGLAHLAGMSQLEFLDLRFTAITDAAAPRLAALANLKRLWLIGSHVSADGVLELRQRLTKCEILWRPLPEGPLLPQAVQPDPLSPTSPNDPRQSRARYFNSSFPLRVLSFSRATDIENLVEPFDSASVDALGRTPSKMGVAVPRKAYWVVEADEVVGDEQRFAAFIAEANSKGLPGISITTAVSDATCRRLADLKHLKILSLEASNISQRGFQHLGKIHSLRMLHLVHLPLARAKCLSHLSPLTQLHTLALSKTKLSADTLVQLAGLKNLTTLRLGYVDGLEAAFTGLASLQQLKNLELRRCLLTGSVFSAIGSHPGLQSLRLVSSASSKHAMRRLAASNTLTSLESISSIPRSQTEEIGRLQNLTRLIIRYGITDDDLRHLQRLRKLRYLDLRGCDGVTSAGLEHIKSLPCLESLLASRLDDVALSHIADLHSLRELHVAESQALTDNGLDALKGMNNLRKLVLVNAVKLTNAGLKKLAKLRNLQWLELNGARRIGSEGIASLASLADLEVLRLGSRYLGKRYDSNLVSVSADAFVQFKHLKRLRVLDLYWAQGIDVATLQQIGAIPSLETLVLSNTGPISDGVSVLGGMPSLRTLVIGGSQLDSTVIEPLRTFAPQLNIIITAADDNIYIIGELPVLTTLWSSLDGVYPDN